MMEYELNRIIKFIRDYYNKYDLSGCVLGISGGKDSAVASALMCKAIGCENVVGLTLPCHSLETDRIDAKKISDYYGFKLYNIDLTGVFDVFKEEVRKEVSFKEEDTLDSDINLKPKLRMASCYYMASLLTSITKKKYLVVGTSNKCELYVGYFTKGGDSVYDISLLGDLTVSEVIKLGELLNVPSDILYKVPSDGLSKMSDEDKMGVSYKEIEEYMYRGYVSNENVSKKIEKMHKGSRHKFNIPMYMKDK